MIEIVGLTQGSWSGCNRQPESDQNSDPPLYSPKWLFLSFWYPPVQYSILVWAMFWPELLPVVQGSELCLLLVYTEIIIILYTNEFSKNKAIVNYQKIWLPGVMLCVQLFNNLYPFPLSQVVPLSQTAPATDPCRNTERSDQPDHGTQTAHANQTPACWAARKHQTETGITGWDGSEQAAPNWPANRRRPAQPACSRQNSRG